MDLLMTVNLNYFGQLFRELALHHALQLLLREERVEGLLERTHAEEDTIKNKVF